MNTAQHNNEDQKYERSEKSEPKKRKRLKVIKVPCQKEGAGALCLKDQKFTLNPSQWATRDGENKKSWQQTILQLLIIFDSFCLSSVTHRETDVTMELHGKGRRNFLLIQLICDCDSFTSKSPMELWLRKEVKVGLASAYGDGRTRRSFHDLDFLRIAMGIDWEGGRMLENPFRLTFQLSQRQLKINRDFHSQMESL